MWAPMNGFAALGQLHVRTTERDRKMMEERGRDQAWAIILRSGGGVTFLGVAAILYGVACVLQGDFAIYWQPVPESLPLRQPLAYLSAGLLVLGGAGLLVRRSVRPAAILLLLLFAFYDLCYLLILVGPPVNPKASLLGLSEQSSVVIGISAIFLRMRPSLSAGVTTARIAFGICSLNFALAHFVALKITASMVPAWMPGGQVFWAIATGIGHLAVGLGLITNRFAVPATRLGALMYVCFALFSWFLGAVAHPTEWLRWAGAAISLCMAAALWLVGDLLAVRNAVISEGNDRTDSQAGELQAHAT
jgi:uncharacterized membrane protein